MTRPIVSTPHGDGPEPIAGEIEGADGVRIRTWSWPVDDARGRVQLVHGLSEHLRRYIELAGVLNRAGWSVFGHDHRGHGESGGEPGVLKDFQHLVDDLERVRGMADELAPGPGSPVLLGHSLGALVAIRYLQTAKEAPARVVVSAPWLGTRLVLPLWQRIAARSLRYVAPDVVIQRPLIGGMLTRDPERDAAYAADPTIHRAGSAGLLARVEEAQEAAMRDSIPESTRILLLLPLDDEVVDPDRTRRWADRISAERIRVVEYPHGLHEPFQDIERATVFRTLVEWLNEDAPRGMRPEQVKQE